MKAYGVYWCATGRKPKLCVFEDNNEDRALAVYGSERQANKVLRAGGPVECSNGHYEVAPVTIERGT